ncbi:MAG: rhodanese-like domain-containing protein [Syntrophobacter sp.]
MLKGIARFTRLNKDIAVAVLSILVLAAWGLPAFDRPAAALDVAMIQSTELNRDIRAWAVLDARSKADFQKGHIPGANSFSWDDYTRTDSKGIPYQILPTRELADALARMGITENTPVAVYGDADKSWGGEGWACWILSWLGHKGPVRLVAGGIQAWKTHGYAISKDPWKEPSSTARYQVSLRPELDIKSSELEQGGSGMVLIDTRSTLEWLSGHLSGAIHIPWTEFYSGKDRHALDQASLRKLLESYKVDLSKPIVYYCAGGVRSGYAWTVHSTCGLPPARNYLAGMEQWKRRDSK